MNKTEFIKAINGKLEGVSLKQTEEQLNATLEVITETLKNREEISILGFGKFEARYKKEQPEKIGRNPQTGEELTISAKDAYYAPAFKAGKSFKDAVK